MSTLVDDVIFHLPLHTELEPGVSYFGLVLFLRWIRGGTQGCHTSSLLVMVQVSLQCSERHWNSAASLGKPKQSGRCSGVTVDPKVQVDPFFKFSLSKRARHSHTLAVPSQHLP